jgi:hypothetical protein
MDTTSEGYQPNTSGPDAPTLEPITAPTRCSICQRRLGKAAHYLEETGDVPAPRQSWALCEACYGAVRAQMAATALQSPVRLRIAVGLVASERTPAARRARFGEQSDRHWERFLFWSFLLAMLAHLVLIVIVAAIAR